MVFNSENEYRYSKDLGIFTSESTDFSLGIHTTWSKDSRHFLTKRVDSLIDGSMERRVSQFLADPTSPLYREGTNTYTLITRKPTYIEDVSCTYKLDNEGYEKGPSYLSVELRPTEKPESAQMTYGADGKLSNFSIQLYIPDEDEGITANSNRLLKFDLSKEDENLKFTTFNSSGEEDIHQQVEAGESVLYEDYLLTAFKENGMWILKVLHADSERLRAIFPNEVDIKNFHDRMSILLPTGWEGAAHLIPAFLNS
jgi:hypothetical protein